MRLGFHTILLATDFSPASELPLEYARSLALRFGSRLHVVHVLEQPFLMAGDLPVVELAQLNERRWNDARQQLARVLADLGNLGATGEVIGGNPARQIVLAAGDQHADLVVMGTHGRGAVAHLLMGSVAERVVRTAPCPVLTIRVLPAPVEAEAPAFERAV